MSRVVTGIGAVGLVAALAWLASPTPERETVKLANRHGPAQPKPLLALSPTPVPSFDGQQSLTPALTQPLQPIANQSTPAAPAPVPVPISVNAPRTLHVGEQSELVVSVGANAGIREISFTVQFDASVLQVRAGAEGDWTVSGGSNGHFVAEISDAEDRVQVLSVVPGYRVGMAGGSVAIIQFQAVAPGTTSITTSDVAVKNSAGGWLASSVSASNLQITVDSGPPPPQYQPESQRLTVATGTSADAANEGD